MALKDWEVLIKSDIRPEWKNKKRFEIIHIFVDRFPTEKWYFYVQYFNHNSKERVFKSKSQALKFAKSYMRRH